MEITTIIKTTATGLAAISCPGPWMLSACLGPLVVALCLGPLAVVAWHRMPDSWLCDYGERKTRTCGERGFAFFPWAFFFSLGFLACAAWLCLGRISLEEKPYCNAGRQCSFPGILSSGFDSLHCVVALLLLWILLLICLADMKFQIIPDQLWVALLPLGLLRSQLGEQGEVLLVLSLGLVYKILAGLFCGGAFWFLGWLSAAWSRELETAVGFGDVKLLFALGFVLGLERGLTVLLCASLLGGVCFGIMVLLGRAGLSDERPFGPYLCLAAAAQVLL